MYRMQHWKLNTKPAQNPKSCLMLSSKQQHQHQNCTAAKSDCDELKDECMFLRCIAVTTKQNNIFTNSPKLKLKYGVVYRRIHFAPKPKRYHKQTRKLHRIWNKVASVVVQFEHFLSVSRPTFSICYASFLGKRKKGNEQQTSMC